MISVLWHLLRHPVANDGRLGKGSAHRLASRSLNVRPSPFRPPALGTILHTPAGCCCCCFSFYQQLRGWVQPPHGAEDLSAAPVWVGSVHTFETLPGAHGLGTRVPADWPLGRPLQYCVSAEHCWAFN